MHHVKNKRTENVVLTTTTVPFNPSSPNSKYIKQGRKINLIEGMERYVVHQLTPVNRPLELQDQTKKRTEELEKVSTHVR